VPNPRRQMTKAQLDKWAKLKEEKSRLVDRAFQAHHDQFTTLREALEADPALAWKHAAVDAEIDAFEARMIAEDRAWRNSLGGFMPR